MNAGTALPKPSPPPTWGGKGWGVAQEGQALIVAILALLVLTLLGLALTSMSMISMTVSTNEREASEALYAADSGIAHAAAIISSHPWLGFDQLLQAGDGQACTGDELATLPIPGGVLPASELIPAAGRSFPPVGSYRVSVCDDDTLERVSQRPPTLPDVDPNHDANARVLIRSTASGRDGASASIEAVLAQLDLPALLVDGNLRIDGSAAVMGRLGSVHANGSLDLPGSPCAQQYFSTSGAAAAGTALGGAGCTRAAADVRVFQDAIPVPQLAPSSLRERADYILGADGVIRNSTGTSVTLAGWSWEPGARRWAGGEDIPGGAYYAEGNIEVSGNPGRREGAPMPLPLTLIAEGWVDVSGSPNIVPALAGTTAYSIVAGADLRISGNPDAACVGLLYAGDQIELNGVLHLNGQVIVRNSGDLGYPPLRTNPAQNNLVRPQAGSIAISGNVTITYNGGGLGTVAFRGWRECRGIDPDNPCGVP